MKKENYFFSKNKMENFQLNPHNSNINKSLILLKLNISLINIMKKYI